MFFPISFTSKCLSAAVNCWFYFYYDLNALKKMSKSRNWDKSDHCAEFNKFKENESGSPSMLSQLKSIDYKYFVVNL